MGDTGESGGRATRRQVLQAAGGALAVGALSGRSVAQATGPTVYVGSEDGTLYAVDAGTGSQEWAFTQPSGQVDSSPTVVDGTVYVGADDKTLYAVDGATGSQEWAFTQPSGLVGSSPTVVDGTVYVGSDDGNLYAVDAGTGSQEWAFTQPSDGVRSSPTVVGGTVYVGSFDNTLYAVDAGTGSQEWAFLSFLDVESSPTVADGTVYVGSGGIGSDDGMVYAVDAGTGSQEWAFTQPSDGVSSSPTVVDGTVYIGSINDGRLYAVDAGTGSQEWAFDASAPFPSSPTVVGGTVYVGSFDNTLYAVDTGTGTQEWAFTQPSGPVWSSPTVVDETVYVGSDDGNLYAVDAGTGSQEWAFTQPSGWVRSSPTVVDDPANGDSTGSRVLLGTLGHRGDRADRVTTVSPASFTITIEEPAETLAGGPLDVTVAVENTGDASGTQDVSLSVPGLGSDSTEVSLDGSDSTTETLSVPTAEGDAGEYTATVESDDNSDEQDVTVLSPAAFTVDIIDTVDPVAGDPLEVTVNVENTGDSQDTQTLELDVPGVGSDSTDTSLDAGTSTELTLSVPTAEGDAGEYTATVESDDNSDDQSVTVLSPAAFTVDIIDTVDPVAGDPLEVTIDVENTGDSQDTQTLGLDVPGVGSDSTDTSLDAGASTELTLSVPTAEGDAGEYTATVESDDSSDEQDVTVLSPAAFTVDITDTVDPVAGNPLEVTVDVENTGDSQDTQTLGLDVPRLGSDSTDTSLDAGTSTELTLSVPTAEGDAGEYTATVESDDSSDEQDVTVLSPAAFTVDIIDTVDPVAGDPLEVTVDVENTGDDAGNRTVELTAGGLGSDSTTVSLDGGNSTSETLSLSTGEGDAGEYDATVGAGDSSDSADVTVLAPAAFTVDIEDTTTPVAGNPLEVTVVVENTGDEAGSRTVELSASGLDGDSVEVDIDGGSSTTEELSLPTDEGDAGEYTVTASTGDSEATETVTVSEPAGDDSTGSPDDGSTSADDSTGSSDDGSTSADDSTGSPDDSTSGDDSTGSPDDGSTSADDQSTTDAPGNRDSPGDDDGGLGTTEMAAIGGGGGLALLLGAYALMRRAGDDSDSTSESTDTSTGGESPGQPSPSPSPSPGPAPGAGHQHGRSDAGGVPSTIPDTPRPSLTYEDITLGDRLGRGGNADVYYATATTPRGDIKIAMKEPRMGGGETLQTDVVERMMTEADTWQQLDDHDHVAGVVDYDTQPLPWIAMEYMDGGHLGERAGEMDTAQKLWTALSVTEGVYHAHNRGIAHRDLKPENILFRRVDGAWDVPKVADWGLSKHLLEHSKSRDGMTVEYAAPEQFSDSASTDDRTDIYQLGAVFYELFTGQPPFEGEMFAVMEQIKTETPTPPSEIADVPDGLDEILLRALAKEPADRYSDIVYLRDDLQGLFDQL